MNDIYEVERLQWEKKDGKFPYDKIHGNFIPSELRKMCERFVLEYQPLIDSVVTRVMNDLINSNSDTLTSGRQTFCPFTNQSVTAALAYKRAYDFLSENCGMVGMSCLDWIKCTLSIFEKSSIRYLTTEKDTIKKKIYNKKDRSHSWVEQEVMRKVYKKTKDVEETRMVMMKMLRRYASYIKHKERGKKNRRAICSAGMFLRMFLKSH